jgi:hypothetical protein
MKSQVFKNMIGSVHEFWVSDALNTPLNQTERRGVDLLDEYKGIEVKSCLIKPSDPDSKRSYVKWTMFDRQLKWHDEYKVPLYFALCTYELSHNVSRLWTKDHKRLEGHVKNRNIWVVPWNWSMQFPSRVGKYHTYKYLRPKPKRSLGLDPLPDVIEKVELSGGTVNFTKGADPSLFI